MAIVIGKKARWEFLEATLASNIFFDNIQKAALLGETLRSNQTARCQASPNQLRSNSTPFAKQTHYNGTIASNPGSAIVN